MFPDEIFHELELESVSEDVTLKGPIVTALESQAQEPATVKPRRIRDPLVRRKNKNPIALTNAEIEDLLI